MTLIDPEKVTVDAAVKVALSSKNSGTSAIMIGGSTFVSQTHLDEVVRAIKGAVNLPTILFPNNVTGISSHADAIWFMSLLNSVDPYFLIGAQSWGLLVKKYKIEPPSMDILSSAEGGTAGIVGKAITVPYNKPEIAAVHALAGQYIGLHFIYLEGGSGASNPVPPEMISASKQLITVPLIVGGGIKTKEQALAAATAGADVIVTGNLTESGDANERISQIIAAIKDVKQ
jgi:phosphoglycerol geranylgeranyltransferase